VKPDGSREVDIYPVGLLADLKHFRGDWWVRGRRVAVARFVRSVRRSWRRRSYWNGYLAEVDLPIATRCGRGWTKVRARLDLARHVAEQERVGRSMATLAVQRQREGRR
jgi:hypothetical protein